MASQRVPGWGWIVASMLASCWQQPTSQRAFRISRVSPDLQAGPALLLNDAITVYFDAPVDPMSVTRDTFAVLDDDGHPVRGRLSVEGSWVTFDPEPPLSRDLLDGSLQPGASYRLVVVGYPRPEGILSRSGMLLEAGVVLPFRAAERGAGPLAAEPLRPIGVDSRPFVLRPADDGALPVPVDDARLQLHFTLPVSPASVSPAAFEISLLPHSAGAAAIDRVEPRAVRLLPRQLVDELPGSTVEIDFGSAVRVHGSERLLALQPDDLLVVRLAVGESALRDYAGRRPPAQVQWCTVVPGESVRVAAWPTPGAAWRWVDMDLALPGFEVAADQALRPLVRVEAGDGGLGVFRPRLDTTIAVGVPFDRGDGTRVASANGVFAFRAIDIPAGITVQLVAPPGGLRLLAMGRIRIDGRLEIRGAMPAPVAHPGVLADLSAIAAGAAVTVVAGTGIEVRGAIIGDTHVGSRQLALVTAGALSIQGTLPPASVLAVERLAELAVPATDRCTVLRVRLTPGLPVGAEAVAVGVSPVVALPADRGGRTILLRGADEVRVAWQVLPADARERDQPDLDPARAAPPRDAADRDRVEVPPGAFVRVRCQARVLGGVPLPRLLGVDVLDR